MRNSISLRAVLVFSLAAAILGLAAAPAGAVVGTWTLQNNGNWSTAGNWASSIMPDAPGDTADFSTVVWSGNWIWTIDSTSRTVGTLKMGYAGSNKFTTLAASGGASLIFDNLGSAAQIIIPNNRGDTISAPILLISSLETRDNSTGNLNISGTVTSNSASAKTISNLGTNTGTVTISGAIADGGGGTVAIVENSVKSMLVLGGNNTYSGATTVTAGVLNIRGGTALGTTDAGTSVASGAALQLEGAVIVVGAEPLTLNGTGITNTGAMRNIRGTNTYGGLVTLAGAARINSDGGTLTLDVASGDAVTGAFNLTLGGSAKIVVADPIATGAGTLNKDGAGTLTLTGVNTYTGLTTISAGRLVLGGAGTLGTGANALTMSGGLLDLGGTADRTAGAVSITAAPAGGETIKSGSLTGTSYAAGNVGGNAIVSANLLASGAAGLAMSGAGTLTLTGTNTYTGGTTVSAGTLIAGGTGSLPGYADSAKIAVGSGGTLAARMGAGWSSGQLDTLKNLGDTSWAAGSLLGIDTANGDFTYASVVGDAGANSRGLAKLGANTLTLDQINTYTGTTAVRGGTLKLQNAGAGLTQTLGALTLAGIDVTLQSDNAGTGTLSTTFGALTARAAGNTANIVSTGGTNGTTNIINLAGAAGFIDKGVYFGGANYAALDAANTYVRALAYGTDPGTSAADTITGGTHVKLTATPAARVGDTLLSLNLAGSGVNYTMSSGTLTVPGILKSGGGAVSTISGGTAVTGGTGIELVVRTDAASDALTVSTPVTGTGALTKSGTGTLTLSSGTNSYTGATYVNGGTLEIGGAGRLGSGTYAGAIYIDAGAKFNYNSTAGQTLSGAISGGGALAQGSGTLTLSGANTGFYGTMTVNAGILVLDSAAALGNASSVTIAGGTELQATGTVPAINIPITVASTGNPISASVIHAVTGLAGLEINAPISGSGNLQLQSTRASSSYFVLNVKSDYTGNTIFCGETPGNWAGRIYVALGIDDALPTGTVLSMDQNYAQFDLSGHNQTLGGLQDRAAGAWWLAWEVVNTSATPSTLTVNNAANCTFSGALGITAADNNFGLTKGGTGTFTLGSVGPNTNGGVNYYRGGTIINGGILEIAGAAKLGGGAYADTISIAGGAALKYNSTAAQTLSGTISGAGRLIKDGAGTLTLTGAGTSGPIAQVNGGTLTLDYSLADSSKLSDLAALVLGGGTLNLSGGTHTEVVASTTLGAGTSSVTRTSGSAVLAMGAISPAGGVVNFGAGSIATTTNTNDAGGILGAWATVGGTDWAANDGSGNIVAYTGGYTDIAATGDTITDGAATNVRLNSAGAGGALALSAAATTVNTLLQNTTTASTIDTAGKTLAVGGIRIASGQQEAVTVGASAGDGTLKAAAAGGVLVLNNGNAAKTLTVNAVIADNTSTSALATAGNVVLKGVNTYTGDTSVGGTLEIGGAGQLGSGAYAGDISFAVGGTLKYTSSAAQTLSGGISTAGTATINNATDLTVSGAISGTGTLIKTGTGTLKLTNTASDYSGVMQVSAGTLEVTKLADVGLPSSIGLAAGPLVLGDGGTAPAPVVLRYVGAGDSSNNRFLFNGNPSTGSLTVTLDASGSGPIKFTNPADFVRSTAGKPCTLILTGTNTDDNLLAANIDKSYPADVAIIKNGTGTWVLTGRSYFQYPNAGAVSVNDGTLKLANALGFRNNTVTMGGNSATLVFDSSVASNAFTFGGLASVGSGTGYDIALQNNAGTPAPIALTVGSSNASTTYAGVLGGPGSLIKAGTGTLTLSGANTYAGTTTVSAGTLIVGSTASLPGYTNSARVTVAAGATLTAVAGGAGWTVEQLDTLKELGSATWAATSILGIDTTNGDFTYASVIGNAGANARNLAKLGANTLMLSNNLSHTGTTTVSGGTLVLSGNNSSANGATTVASGATLRVGAAGNIPAGALTLAAGTLDLIADGGTNFGKNFTVSTGTTKINVDRATGGGPLNGIHMMGTMSIGAQTLNVTGGSGYRLALGAVTLTGAATLNPTANLTVASVTGAAQNLTLGGTATDNAVTGNITTTTGTVTKSGTGTWTLNGTNTYAGATTINAGGKLYVNGTHNPSVTTAATTYSVLGTLGGSGTITTSADAVTVGNGGKLAPGAADAPGTLTMNLGAAALSLDAAKANNAGEFTFRIGAASDKIVLGAGTSLNLGTATADDLSLDWSDFTFVLGAGLVEGAYTLIDAGTTATGALSTGVGLLSGPISTGTGTLSIAGAQDLILTVTGLVKPGDTNGDKVVDAADFITLKKNFGGGLGGDHTVGNFNKTGTVNWADLSILMSNMGTGGGAPATAPEPCSAMLLIFGAAALLRRRRS
jgi:autotransporter-associated beta strand protein